MRQLSLLLVLLSLPRQLLPPNLVLLSSEEDQEALGLAGRTSGVGG
jgi:hypothetical protein